MSCGHGSWRSLKVTEGWTNTTCNTHTVAMPHRKRSFWLEHSWGVFFQANTWEILWFDNKGHLLVKCMTHMQNTADKNKHIHKHGETQTRGENEISNSSKTTSHRWTHFGKNMQRITRLYIKANCIYFHKTTYMVTMEKAEDNTGCRNDCSLGN